MATNTEVSEKDFINPAPKTRGIEAMRDPGFHIGKIDSRTLDAISDFGLKIANGKNKQGNGVVVLNSDGKFRATIESGGKTEAFNGGIEVDDGTKELKVYALKQDGFPKRPDAPLRIMSENKDGTTDYITFEKNDSNNQIKQLDEFIKNYNGNSRDLMNSRELKPMFDQIVKNWLQISDTSVAKIKALIRDYATSENVSLPSNFKLGITEHKNNPAFKVADTNILIFNGGDNQLKKPTEKLNLKPDEKSTSIVLESGKTIELVEKSAKDGYMDGNYGYRAILIDNVRYDIVNGSTMRMRDGGTTYSTFRGNGKVFELYQPTPFARKQPTLTEK